MSFGGQTVTFVTFTAANDGGDSLGIEAQTATPVDVPGCRFRPFSVKEDPDAETNVAWERWKCTAPPEAAALAAKSTGELICDGVTYQIDGPVQPKPDMAGDVEHVTIFCKRQYG